MIFDKILHKNIYNYGIDYEFRKRNKGDSIEFVKRTLLGGDSKIYSFLDKSTVEKLVKEHLSGTENRRLLIWSLLNVEQWLNDGGISLNSRT